MKYLKSPYPWFGGKSTMADAVWERFGSVRSYIEPFFGSGAVLLGRPDVENALNSLETVNDINGFVVNFWRAIQADPEKVAYWADWPISEIDKNARQGWLMNRAERLVWALEDPDYFDAKIAGWWVWGVGQDIGGSWCRDGGKWQSDGCHIRIGNGPNSFSKQIPNIGSEGGKGVHALVRRGKIPEYFMALSERMRTVRIVCGDWKRVLGPAVTKTGLTTAIFLDPPYNAGGHSKDLYTKDYNDNISAEVRAWCLENGDDKNFRIALCGYEGEHVMPSSWTCVRGRCTNGGYGNLRKNGKNENGSRERIWFSPGCLEEKTLFRFEATAEDRLEGC